MKKEDIEILKEYLMEIDPCIKFDDEYEEDLIGYAERFGCHLIPLYNKVNTFLYDNPETCIKNAQALREDVCLFAGLEKSIVGYVILENGKVSILHDKEKLINNLAKEYEEEGMEIDLEDDSYYSQALQWYEFNIIGTGLSDMTTPAFACTEEFPLPVALNS